MTGAVGRHDRGGEAISGTSKAPGNEGSLASRAAFKHADLGLNHYQKKGEPLDRKMERQSVCKWVGGRERKARGGEAHKRRRWQNSESAGPESEEGG